MTLRIIGRIGVLAATAAIGIVAGRSCGAKTALPVSSDMVVVTGDAGSDLVALVDGRTEDGCVRDVLVRGRGVLTLGNFLEPRGCHTELTVFQADRAMFNTTSLSWDAETGNRVPVHLARRLETVDVLIRLTSEMNNKDRRRALNDLARANILFNTMRCGVRFKLAAPIPPPDRTLKNINSCDDITANRDTVRAERGKVNVYYTPNLAPLSKNDQDGPRGVFCEDADATVLISRSGDNESLAHELGHVLSLDHGGDHGNVMIEGAARRYWLAEGQCFRCNQDERTFLKWRKKPDVPDRSCNHGANHDKCPPGGHVSRFMPEPAYAPSFTASQRAPEVPLPPVEQDELDAILSAWLYCVECNTPELKSLLSPVPEEQRDVLAGRLNEMIRSQYRRDSDLLKNHLLASYDALKVYQPSHAEEVLLGSESREDYADLYLPSYRDWLKRRALITLLGLNTPRSIEILVGLRDVNLESDLKQLLDRLIHVATTPP